MNTTSGLEHLVGTPLEGITLDMLLQNVEDNEIWNEDRVEVEKIKQKVRTDYHNYTAAFQTDESISLIARKLNLSVTKVQGWKEKGSIPRSCKPYLRSFFPQTESEKADFAYFLGAITYGYFDPDKEDTRSISKTFDDPRLEEKFCRKVENILGKRPSQYKNGLTKIMNQRFVKFVSHVMRNQEAFERIVSDDETRKELLEGAYETSAIHPTTYNDSFGLIFTLKDEQKQRRYLETMFHVGIYPSILRDNTIAVVGKPNLERVLEVGFLSENDAAQLQKFVHEDAGDTDFTVQFYSDVLTEASAQKEAGEFGYKKLAEQCGLNEKTVHGWVKGTREPFTVTRYKILVDMLDVDDTYGICTKEVPDKKCEQPPAPEKIPIEPIDNFDKMEILEVGDTTYRLPLAAQRMYMESYGIRNFGEEDRDFIRSELAKIPKERGSVIRIDDDGVITKIHVKDS